MPSEALKQLLTASIPSNGDRGFFYLPVGRSLNAGKQSRSTTQSYKENVKWESIKS